MYLLRTEVGLSAAQTGQILGREPATVRDLSRLVARGERAGTLVARVKSAVGDDAHKAAHTVPNWIPRRARQLAAVRRAAGLTQDELAIRAGVARETLSRTEHGRPAHLKTVAQLAAALSVPFDFLVADRDVGPYAQLLPEALRERDVRQSAATASAPVRLDVGRAVVWQQGRSGPVGQGSIRRQRWPRGRHRLGWCEFHDFLNRHSSSPARPLQTVARGALDEVVLAAAFCQLATHDNARNRRGGASHMPSSPRGPVTIICSNLGLSACHTILPPCSSTGLATPTGWLWRLRARRQTAQRSTRGMHCEFGRRSRSET